MASPYGAGGYVRLTAAGCVERLCSLTLKGAKVKRFLSLTALRAEGCGIAAFGGDEYEVSVTGFTFVSLLLYDEVPEPPSSGRGGAVGDGG